MNTLAVSHAEISQSALLAKHGTFLATVGAVASKMYILFIAGRIHLKLKPSQEEFTQTL